VNLGHTILETCAGTLGGPRAVDRRVSRGQWLERLKVRHRAGQELRRGICLLNAGRFQEAVVAFSKARQIGCEDASLPSYVAAALFQLGRSEEAVAELGAPADSPGASASNRIRHALALRRAGKTGEAIECLQNAIRQVPQDAELHFQLGTVLAGDGQTDEAELRFTQALNLNPRLVEARVNLALCCGTRGAISAAVEHLQQAQADKPNDARIGFLLGQAAQALRNQGETVQVRATMPVSDPEWDARELDELSRTIESEPDFVDAFLSLSDGEVEPSVFAILLRTIQAALERQPEHAELHHHCGRVLERLGRRQAAIDANERAVRIDPKFTRALIELGKLYQQTDRNADATTRLEQAVAAGAEYADVYYLLGNLYRDQGQTQRAQSAYRRALRINQRYEAAREALAALTV
jgi:tetratricopeptide (TPR) repeat protein